MKLSTISTIYAVLCGAGTAMGMAFEPPTSIESSNSTGEVSELLDSLIWLDDDLAPYLGDKVPGDNFLNLCSGDHSGDTVSIDKVDLTPNPPIK